MVMIMWNWILTETNKIVNAISNSCVDKNEIVSSVCLELTENVEKAEYIYENKRYGLLIKMVKGKLYEMQGNKYYDTKTDYTRYKKIIAVCDTYDIDPISDNAYKIEALIEDKAITISMIERLLRTKREPVVVFSQLSEKGEVYGRKL